LKKIKLKIMISIVIIYFLFSFLVSIRGLTPLLISDPDEFKEIAFSKERVIKYLNPATNEFGASIGDTGYNFGAGGSKGNSFGNIYSGTGGAAGYRAPPNYIVGGYAPSNEWKLWSEVPLE
jgi:cell division protein FtsW (lipid II flippase)